MNKSSIMALLATVVLSVPASAYESLEISETSAENASELFGPSVNAIFHGVESLLDSASVESTLGDISHDGIALSFDLTSKISNVVYDVVRGTWTVTTDASAKVLAPSWEVSTNAAGYISKSVVFKSLVEFSTDVVTSDGAVKTGPSVMAGVFL